MKSPRPCRLKGTTYEMRSSCGKVYVVCNDHDGALFEVFIRLAKSGTCAAAIVNSIAVSTSIALRSGARPVDLARGLVGNGCSKSESCIDAIGRAMFLHLGEEG